jgi:hypothetical protein
MAMKTFIPSLVLVLASVLTFTLLSDGAPGEAQEKPAPKKPDTETTKLSELMRRKQQLAHELFDALVLKDFKRVVNRANSLISISKDGEFQVDRTPRYMQYSQDFLAAAEKLAENAREKNADGVASAFTKMTLSCVHCHDYIREKQNK